MLMKVKYLVISLRQSVIKWFILAVVVCTRVGNSVGVKLAVKAVLLF